MRTLRKLAGMAVSILVLACGASAVEVAFYPFSEGSDGDDAIGVALHNAVDASALGGNAVRVLSAKELLRASDIPPDDKALETSFHWTFESNATGASLGTVPNEALWRVRYGTPSRTSIHTPWCIAWRTPATTAARPYASSLITRSARP